MNMDAIRNLVRGEVLRVLRQVADVRVGIVDGYDPNRYMAKVRILPEYDSPLGDGEQAITGWLPIATDWVGNGWGDFAPPSPGEQVYVVPHEADAGGGVVAGRVFDAQHLPISVASGERLIQHQSGSYIHFANDGSITISAANGLVRLAAETLQLHASMELRYDVNGYGYVMKYDGTKWLTDSWTTGASAGTAHSINAPEIPE